MSLKKENGFSLVEIALVLLIFGFVSSFVLVALRTYTERVQVTRTQDAVSNSRTILRTFESENGRFPCPAPLNVGPGNPAYGVEMAGAALAANARQGRNDLDGDGVNDDYVFGAVPHVTIMNDPTLSLFSTEDLNFAAKDGIDGYGNKVLYVVSRHLCEAGNPLAGNPEGVLDVVTEATCPSLNPLRLGVQVPQSILPGTCEGPDRRYAQFVILSHGENGRGAYTEGGALVENCVDIALALPPLDPGLGALGGGDWFNDFASERKNCKYDRLNAPGRRNGEFFTGLYSEGTVDGFYDDYIKFSYSDEFQIFSSAAPLPAIATDGTPYEISRMQNVNEGEIGIGLQDPEEVLHINGDMQAFDIEAEEYCADIDTNKCMPIEVLTNVGIACAGGEAIDSIELNNVSCSDPFAGLTFTCPLPNERLRTVRSDGTFVCCDPLTTPSTCTSY